MSENEYFVYLYRDSRGRPIYVGRGRRTGRALDHHDHNTDLVEKLGKNENHTIEIAGPLQAEDAADKVETALISAFRNTPLLSKYLLNKHENTSRYRFRKLAVPVAFADRDGQKPLEKADLEKLVVQSGGPLLFVNISNKNFKDAARGFDPARPPQDKYVLARFESKWQLRKIYDELWSKESHLFPRTLIGLFGPPDAKIVIGAVKIDRDPAGRWNCSDANFFARGLMSVPVSPTQNHYLDEMKLRGRTVAAKKVSLQFGPRRHQFFRIFPPIPSM